MKTENGVMHGYVTHSKFTTKPYLGKFFSKHRRLYGVFTWDNLFIFAALGKYQQ